MLRDVVKNFLESLTEREFDAPLLALLASQGFTDVHFIHGGFEFGKDIIAKRLDPDGSTLRQYSIQSKAGDIGTPEWRSVRPQLEECEYNTRAHPNFDADLPRTALLVTTGVLKGAAPIDAQAFRAACTMRGLADFEVWDQEDLLNWFSKDPALGLDGVQVQDDLITLLNSIGRGQATEPYLERHTRAWITDNPGQRTLGRAAIEAALISKQLRMADRLDLASLLALHLYRASWLPAPSPRSSIAAAALRMFVTSAAELLTQAEPLLGDPKRLADALADIAAPFTYPATCVRLAETFSLLALTEATGDVHERAVAAVISLATQHPGTARPPSDQFAAAILPTTLVLAANESELARTYLREVGQWLLDRHDESTDGLGLGGIDEDERTQFERLVAGKTTLTGLAMRRSSYMAGAVLDALALVEARELYDTVLKNIHALRIVPSATAARESHGRWRRGGPDVHLHPRIDYLSLGVRRRTPPLTAADALDSVLLASVTRNRHYLAAYEQMLAATRSSD